LQASGSCSIYKQEEQNQHVASSTYIHFSSGSYSDLHTLIQAGKGITKELILRNHTMFNTNITKVVEQTNKTASNGKKTENNGHLIPT
jgi:hypothetical protein